jgi:DNA-binding response OmpR family regulator
LSAHILLIDDDESLLDVLAMTLEDEVDAVTQLHGGDVRLGLYVDQAIDLIVRDINSRSARSSRATFRSATATDSKRSLRRRRCRLGG